MPQPALSGNGRWIAWRSTAGDELLGDNDFSHNEHVFMRSRDAGSRSTPSTSVRSRGIVRHRHVGRPQQGHDDGLDRRRRQLRNTVRRGLGRHVRCRYDAPPGGSCTIAVQFDSHGLESEITGSLDVREVGYDPLASSGALRARVTPAPEPDPKLDEPTTSRTVDTDDRRPRRQIPRHRPNRPRPRRTVTWPRCRRHPIPSDFGIVPVGITSAAPSVVTVQNIGNAAGTPTVALGGEHAGDFRIVSDTCSATELAPGAVCTVEVVTQPTGGGPRTAALSVRVDAARSTSACSPKRTTCRGF